MTALVSATRASSASRAADRLSGLRRCALLPALIAASLAAVASASPPAAGNPKRSNSARDGGLKARPVPAGGHRPVPGGDRPARLRRPEQPPGVIGTRYQGLGRAARRGRLRRAAVPTAMVRAGSAANAACASARSATSASGSPTPMAARDWLQKQDWVIADRVSLLGWSSGGITALWAVRARAQALRRRRRTSARRWRSIPAAAGSATRPGARACRR